MDYIKTPNDKKKLLRVCRYLDAKNTHMLSMATFLSQLSKYGIILSEKDSEFFQEKFMLPNGKVIYENAIDDLSASLKEKTPEIQPKLSEDDKNNTIQEAHSG